jgi:hypothetical protein
LEENEENFPNGRKLPKWKKTSQMKENFPNGGRKTVASTLNLC